VFETLRGSLSRKEVVESVSNRYGVTKTTVYHWYKGSDPFGDRAGRVSKVPELLYVLGALLGDGCAYLWHHQFQLWLVGEEEFTTKFAAKLSVCLGRKVGHYKYGGKNAWFVKVENAELFLLFGAARKNHYLVRRLIADVAPLRGWIEFVEGFFDAEGCVKVIRGKERRIPKICLDFCNTDSDLLEIAREGLGKFGIESNMSAQHCMPPRKTSYHLRIYSKSGVAKFLATFHTTKLTGPKKPFVDIWLTKKR